MQCPACGNENPDDAQVCESCSFVLTSPDTLKSKTKAKTSKTVICAVILAGLSGILVIFMKPTLAFFAAIFAFYSAIADIRKFSRRKNKEKVKRTTAATGVVVLIVSSLQMLILSYWRIDAAPVPNDYTINDIRSAAPKYNHTYRLLQSLADKNADLTDAAAIGLSREDVKNLEEINNIFKENDFQTISQQLQVNADSILSIWQNAKKGREVFAKLDTFPEIADLTKPKLELEIDLPFITNLRCLVFLHRAYICLQSYIGNQEAAIGELIRLDSIFKKMNLNARSLITKLLCISCFNMDIQTANSIINNPDTTHEELTVLKKHIVPFSDEHTSLRNSMIFEYLTLRNKLTEISNEPSLRFSIFSPLKLNSALRLYRNTFDKWVAIEENRKQIKEPRVWPNLYPNLPVKMIPGCKLPRYYRLYNPVGSLTLEFFTPSIERVFEIRTKLKIHSDLLQIVLNKRLGREVSLKARVYSDEYIVDIENKKIFSPGPDGRINTKDDIKLMINPEVLGWQN